MCAGVPLVHRLVDLYDCAASKRGALKSMWKGCVLVASEVNYFGNISILMINILVAACQMFHEFIFDFFLDESWLLNHWIHCHFSPLFISLFLVRNMLVIVKLL